LSDRLEVTIGLCVKNSEKTIGKCVKSIINQNYPHHLLRIIIVDGKSVDETIRISRETICGSNLIADFFSDEGEGLGVARQIIFNHSKGKYIVWIDSDTIIDSNFVREQVKFMETNSNVCVATGNYVQFRKTNENLPATLESAGKYLGSHTFKPRKDMHGLPPNDASIYRVEALKQIKGFDIRIRGASEDEDVINRMLKKGWLITVNPTAYYHAFPKATWHSLWRENAWFGHGSHFINHKTPSLHLGKHHIPYVIFLVSFRNGVSAYRLTGEKKTFLFPIAAIFSTTAWWYGYLTAHFSGYGH
jgi:glycosyltransferase involved in cell wall biosynthesis